MEKFWRGKHDVVSELVTLSCAPSSLLYAILMVFAGIK